MKNKILFTIFLAFSLFLVINNSYAYGGRWIDNQNYLSIMQQKFENWAKILNLSVEEVKNYWAQGKNLFLIAQEKGISLETIQNKIRELRLEQERQRLNYLVEKGFINKEQMEKRLNYLNQNMNNKNFKKMQGGFLNK